VRRPSDEKERGQGKAGARYEAPNAPRQHEFSIKLGAGTCQGQLD
jgi:hypothetical protein